MDMILKQDVNSFKLHFPHTQIWRTKAQNAFNGLFNLIKSSVKMASKMAAGLDLISLHAHAHRKICIHTYPSRYSLLG